MRTEGRSARSMQTMALMRVFALLLLVVGPSATAGAQDHVLLSEIVPALEGTELGALEVGPAPPPGASRQVHRGEVLSALGRAGRTPAGLAIPARTRVHRSRRVLEPTELATLARGALERVAAPCVLEDVAVSTAGQVGTGALDVDVDAETPPRSGTFGAVIVVREGSREVRVPARMQVRCPAPVVQPGDRLRVAVRVGGVTAATDAVARQPGRVGDVIQASRDPGQARLRVRVLDARTAEVVQ